MSSSFCPQNCLEEGGQLGICDAVFRSVKHFQILCVTKIGRSLFLTLKYWIFFFFFFQRKNCIALNKNFVSSVFLSKEVKKRLVLLSENLCWIHRAILSTDEVQHICLSIFFSLALQLQGNTVKFTRVKWPPNHNVAYQSPWQHCKGSRMFHAWCHMFKINVHVWTDRFRVKSGENWNSFMDVHEAYTHYEVFFHYVSLESYNSK